MLVRTRNCPRVGVGLPDSPGGGGGEGFGGCGTSEMGALEPPSGRTTSHRKGHKVNSLWLYNKN
jgi:hypothetical protein